MKRCGFLLSMLCVAIVAFGQAAKPAARQAVSTQKRAPAAKKQTVRSPIDVAAEASKRFPPPARDAYADPNGYAVAMEAWTLQFINAEAEIAVQDGRADAYRQALLGATTALTIATEHIRDQRGFIEKQNRGVEEMTARYKELVGMAKEAVDYIKNLQAGWRNLKDAYDKTYSAHVELLDYAKRQEAQLNEANVRLSMQEAQLNEANARAYRQAQISNAMAIYSLMPRYTPPQTINLNVNWSDCTKYPALCVR